jgi:beta-lactamase regulating signal transducer with metallopeptidase domain
MISLESLSFFVIYACASVAAWLATYMVHSTLIIGGVWLIDRVTSPGRDVREVAWKAALIGGVVTATLAVATGIQPLSGRYETASVVEASWQSAPDTSPLLRLLPTIIVGLWILYASFVLLKVAFVTTHARRSLGPRSDVDNATREVVKRVAQTMRVTETVRVTVSETLASPVVLGASEIALPRRILEEFTLEEQRSVIGHELAHLARRDPWWLMVAATIESLFFFQLLNRMARMKWQEQSEYLCDELAVRAEGSPLPLARSLARVAEWSRADIPQLLAPALAEQPSSLLGRVQQLVERDKRAHMTSRTNFIALSAALLLAVLGGSPAFAPGSVRGWGTPVFHWSGALSAGQSIEMQGVMGSIHAVSTESDSVTVRATRHGRSTNPDIRFEVVRTEKGATVCVLYPAPAPRPANKCEPGARGQYNTRANDVEVEFAVSVPRGVGLIASSATGNITTNLLSGPVSAYSSSGNINVAMAATDWSGVRELESKSGNLKVSLPRNADVNIAAETRTGSIKSDFAIGQRTESLVARWKLRGSLGSSARGVIGRGGRELHLSTIAGNIAIKAN